MFNRRAVDWLTGVVICGAVLATVLALRYTGQLQFINFLTYDTLVRVTSDAPTSSSPISVVTISKADIQALQRWPLTDQMLADVLRQLVSYNPVAIGVNIYRDFPVTPGTQALDDVLRKYSSIIMAEKFGDGQILNQISPPTVLLGTEQVGFTDVIVDGDGVVRRGLLYLDAGGPVHLSMALRLALYQLSLQAIRPQSDPQNAKLLKLGRTTFVPLDVDNGAYVDADTKGYQYLLDYKVARESFASYSLSEVMSRSVSAAEFKDKIVLLGVVADSVKGYFHTPLDRGAANLQLASGVVLHASMVDQILRAATEGDAPVRPIEEQWEIVSIVLCGLFAIFLGFYASTWRGIIGELLLGVAVIILVAFLLFEAGYWLPVAGASLAWFGCAMLITAYVSTSERALRKLIMQLFATHVSSGVAEAIWQQRHLYMGDGRLKAQNMIVTTLFCDLENYTPISEQLEPDELMQWLTEYTDQMTQIVMHYGGVVDDFYGDAIKAEFGVPIARTNNREIKHDAITAVQCAADMVQVVTTMNRQLQQQNLPQVRVRMGIATGEVIAGVIGSARRMRYTTVGDVINTAARLEQFAKTAPSEVRLSGSSVILMTEYTAKLVIGKVKTKPFGPLALKGKSTPVEIYRLVV